MTNLVDKLTEVFATTHVAYTRSHIAHLNIEGLNFYSWHKLLQKIYESNFEDIDTLGEFIRTLKAYVPMSSDAITDLSAIDEMSVIDGTEDDLLKAVRDDLHTLVNLHHQLIVAANDDDEEQIANHSQDRLAELKKFIWMINSSLG